jgi:hypothetical protein
MVSSSSGPVGLVESVEVSMAQSLGEYRGLIHEGKRTERGEIDDTGDAKGPCRGKCPWRLGA